MLMFLKKLIHKIYDINDLLSKLPEDKSVLFADDTNIILNDTRENNLQVKINGIHYESCVHYF